MPELKINKPSHSGLGPLENGLPQLPQFCVDYGSQNMVTGGNDYPIPSGAKFLMR